MWKKNVSSKKYKKARKSFRKYRPKKINTKVHYFKLTYFTEYTVTNAGFVGQSNEVELQNNPAYTDFIAMFDEYKINAVQQKFVFNKNSSDVGVTTAGYELPQLITVNDYNDKTVLANENEAIQYETYKSRRLDRPVSRYYKPQIKIAETSSSAPVMFRSKWIATTDPDVEHLGLKWAVDTISSATGTTIGTLKVYTTVYLACKDPR